VRNEGQDRQSEAMDPVGELNERVARLEERIETMKADLTATLEGFRTDQAILREDMAKRDAASARRETWMLGTVITVIAVGLTIHGFLTS